MVEDAVIHGCTGLHPVEITKEDIRNIYYKLKGQSIPNCVIAKNNLWYVLLRENILKYY